MKKQKTILVLGVLFTLYLFSCSKKDSSENTSSFVLNAEDLKGEINDGTVTLTSDKVYKLTGPLVVKNSATLKIEAGTTIEAQSSLGASTLYISIERGGRIEAVGTAAKPIKFTATTKEMGAWGGIVIHGKSPNNTGENAASEINGTQYGGNVSNDNSGIMQYIIIEYSGAKNGDKEFNGLSFFSVGSGTIIDHIAIFNGGDDAFEWYGGNVNCSYLYAKDNDDDNFDYDLGYTGKLVNLYSINSNTNASSDSRGIEADNHPNQFTASPNTNPTIENVTLVGRGTTVSNQREGIYLRRGVQSDIKNVYISGFKDGVGVEHDETIQHVSSGKLKVTNIQYGQVTTKVKGKNTKGESSNVNSVIISEGNNLGAGNGADKPTWANWF